MVTSSKLCFYSLPKKNLKKSEKKLSHGLTPLIMHFVCTDLWFEDGKIENLTLFSDTIFGIIKIVIQMLWRTLQNAV